MADNRYRQSELEEYIRQGEPSAKEKSFAWKTAIGLQQVDGLSTSAYLLDTAKEHIEGKISIHEAQERIHNYYKAQSKRAKLEERTEEADIVAARITELLGEKTFQFSPAFWSSIHRRLFEGVYAHAGQFRDYNITKNEWILKGDTVIYASADSIMDTLEYDFRVEKEYSYAGRTAQELIEHFAKFTAGIWQIHPFAEGNTRATAVFIIKYLQTFGFSIDNDAFEKNSWYFRNALVRANYNDLQHGVHETTLYLEQFFSNLLLGTEYELKNRRLHLDWQDEAALKGQNEIQSATTSAPKCQNGTLAGTLELSIEELAILNIIRNDSAITQAGIAKITGQSLRTIKRLM
ncbi:MAG: Fic family protein, partial [Phascolarctobacterium sp.]